MKMLRPAVFDVVLDLVSGDRLAAHIAGKVVAVSGDDRRIAMARQGAVGQKFHDSATKEFLFHGALQRWGSWWREDAEQAR
jgi:hypothetical protein